MSDDRQNERQPRDDARLLAAGHALGSLTSEERATYERLLQHSEEARSEASAFDEVASALSATPATAEPPADLKARLMAQIATTPQDRPADATHAPSAETPAPVPAAPAAGDGEAAPTEASDVRSGTRRDARPATQAEQKAQRRWYGRPLVLVAAAAAAAVLFAGGTAVGFSVAQHSSTTVQADALASITSAPDAQRASAKVAGGGTATLVWSASLGKSAMIVDGVGSAPAGSTYQLWYIRDGHATSAGLMSGQWQVLDGGLHQGDVVGLTVEPSGGSKQPTTKPIVTIAS